MFTKIDAKINALSDVFLVTTISPSEFIKDPKNFFPTGREMRGAQCPPPPGLIVDPIPHGL